MLSLMALGYFVIVASWRYQDCNLLLLSNKENIVHNKSR